MKKEFIHFTTLIYRIFLVIVIFEISRLLFILFNSGFFSKFSTGEILSVFWYGLLFDISAVLYLNSLFILISVLPVKFRELKPVKLIMKILFFIVNGIAIVFNIIDCEYYKFTNKRTGIDFFRTDNEVDKIIWNYLLDYWYLLLIIIALIILMIYLYNRKKIRIIPAYTLKSYLIQVFIFILTIGLFITGGRGGFNLKPIRPFDAARFVQTPLIPAVLNTPFTMIFTAQNFSVTKKNFMPDKEAIKLYNPIHYKHPEWVYKEGENVFIIILESFGQEVIGFYNHGKGYTPFLDSICRQSMVFKDAFANDKSSNKAIPCILAGMPSWMDVPYINSNYQGNQLNSLGELLKTKGYTSAFFHGARNGSMALDNFVSICNFGSYYGMNEYPYKTDYDGKWGIFDEPYLQYVASTVNGFREPFCCAVFTLSSHHPYLVPDKYKSKFKGGPHPIHKSIEYADYALGEFFKKASGMKWFRNTLFVITADHSAENLNPYYQTMPGRYLIPLIFYRSDGDFAKHGFMNLMTVQQIDIMPTVLSLLGYDKPYFSFGEDFLFDSKKKGAIQYDNGVWQYIKFPYILHFNGSSVVGFYNYPDDPFLKSNLKSKKMDKMARMETELKAVIQTYYRDLIDNKTHIDQ